MTRTSRTAAAALLAAASLTLAAPASASAGRHLDPAQHSCSASLARAHGWPGTMPLHGGTYVLVSDAFVTHLGALPSCRGGPPALS
ncbi:hypothetical protein [Blastococcus sp. URHD0036]|uniref:hypothetical protein n=1 Tax=Blastococcus sp. URHD0036 TaxID=1380356 RepID=UPI000495D157|nr:hypothetical protein [Blastococcus sp. URHD0036]